MLGTVSERDWGQRKLNNDVRSTWGGGREVPWAAVGVGAKSSEKGDVLAGKRFDGHFLKFPV